MAARRCDNCDRNQELDTFTCAHCGGQLWYSNIHDPDPAAPVVVDDPVENWRFEQLLRASYPADAALQLATRHDVDLHRAVGLVENGCDAELAARILL